MSSLASPTSLHSIFLGTLKAGSVEYFIPAFLVVGKLHEFSRIPNSTTIVYKFLCIIVISFLIITNFWLNCILIKFRFVKIIVL